MYHFILASSLIVFMSASALAESAGKASPLSNKEVKSKKKKVVLICYDGSPCPAIERYLKAEKCSEQVEVEKLPYFPTLKTVGESLDKSKFPEGSIVIVSGHASNMSYSSWMKNHPEAKKINSYSGRFDAWVKGVSTGDDHAMSMGYDDPAVDSQDLRALIQKKIKDPAIWFATCHAGGLCVPEGCVGGSCQAAQVTTMHKKDNMIDPVTKGILALLCDPKKREQVDSQFGGKEKGVLEPAELDQYFQCEAQDYPFTYTVHYRVTASNREEREAQARRSVLSMLHQYMTIESTEGLESFEAIRVKLVQDIYKDQLNKDGKLTQESLKEKVSITAEKNGEWLTVTGSLPRPNKPAPCFWGGSDPQTPRVGTFRLKTH